jgi:predicted dienelactone hydrolase
MRRSVRWLLPLLSVLVLPLALLQACAVETSKVAESTRAAAGDPGAPGPYPVGVTEIVFERPSSTTGKPRILNTLVWYPAADSARGATEDDVLHGVRDAPPTTDNRPLPIIMFSHGSGGLTWQSTYYTTHLASYGFVVVAPPHPGNTAADCMPCTDMAALADAFLNRPTDVTFALESMLKLNDDPASMFYQALDGKRVGMSGHSFGGLVTLQLAASNGAKPFLAALAMAPAVGGVAPSPGTSVPIPLMIMGGGMDYICPVENDREYLGSLQSSSPHYLVVFPRGGHLAYSDQCIEVLGDCGANHISQEKAHQAINFYATAFFKTYVAGDENYAAYLDPQANTGDPDIEFEASTP